MLEPDRPRFASIPQQSSRRLFPFSLLPLPRPALIAAMPPTPPARPRVLVADASLPNRRLIREALTAFRHCDVDDAATAEHAFERALMQEYGLFIFALGLPDFGGNLLDRLLARAYPRCHRVVTAPPVIYLVKPDEQHVYADLQRDARVRGSSPIPLNLDALVTAASAVLPAKPPAS